LAPLRRLASARALLVGTAARGAVPTLEMAGFLVGCEIGLADGERGCAATSNQIVYAIIGILSRERRTDSVKCGAGIIRHTRPTRDGDLLIHQSSVNCLILVTLDEAKTQ
jgi:hypothetical protein